MTTLSSAQWQQSVWRHGIKVSGCPVPCPVQTAHCSGHSVQASMCYSNPLIWSSSSPWRRQPAQLTADAAKIPRRALLFCRVQTVHDKTTADWTERKTWVGSERNSEDERENRLATTAEANNIDSFFPLWFMINCCSDDGQNVVLCATESDINGQQRRILCCNEITSSLMLLMQFQARWTSWSQSMQLIICPLPMWILQVEQYNGRNLRAQNGSFHLEKKQGNFLLHPDFS